LPIVPRARTESRGDDSTNMAEVANGGTHSEVMSSATLGTLSAHLKPRTEPMDESPSSGVITPKNETPNSQSSLPPDASTPHNVHLAHAIHSVPRQTSATSQSNSMLHPHSADMMATTPSTSNTIGVGV